MIYNPGNDTASLSNKPRIGIAYIDILIFIIPVSRFIEFEAIGQLYAPDLILLAILPLLLHRARLLWQPEPRVVIILIILWFASQVLTDVIMHTPFGDLMRGWSKIGFTLTSFVALFLLLDARPKSVLIYAFGLAVGGFLAYFINPYKYANDLPWKFGYGTPVTWLAILFASLAGGKAYLSIIVTSITGLVNFIFEFRSMGAKCFLVASDLFLSKQLAGRRIGGYGAIVFGVAFAVLGTGLIIAYEYTAKSGLLGAQARDLYEQQSAGDLGLLIGGRSDALGAIQPIVDSPIIGHGSWAKDCEYYKMWIDKMTILGYEAWLDPNSECIIPSHSHLLGAWVDAGIFGAIFWIWVLKLAVTAAYQNLTHPNRLAPVISFIALTLIWDIFFSPFAAERRFITPYYICVVIFSLQWIRNIDNSSATRTAR